MHQTKIFEIFVLQRFKCEHLHKKRIFVFRFTRIYIGETSEDYLTEIFEEFMFRILTNVLPKPPPKLATDLTTYVDKHGKAVIRVGNYQECSNLSQKIESLTRTNVCLHFCN